MNRVKNPMSKVKSSGAEIKYLWFWFLSMGLWLLCELFIPAEVCSSVHIFLDDKIPFISQFVFFYVLWYFLIAGSLIFFLVKNPHNFKRFLIFMTICQIIAVVIFILFPNKQNLRPSVISRDNVFSELTYLIHSVDTNTNVCPSLHVAYSVAMASAWFKERIGAFWKILWIVLAVLISLSTVFVKQHSALDIIVAIPVCVIAEVISYSDFRKKRKNNYKK